MLTTASRLQFRLNIITTVRTQLDHHHHLLPGCRACGRRIERRAPSNKNVRRNIISPKRQSRVLCISTAHTSHRSEETTLVEWPSSPLSTLDLAACRRIFARGFCCLAITSLYAVYASLFLFIYRNESIIMINVAQLFTSGIDLDLAGRACSLPMMKLI